MDQTRDDLLRQYARRCLGRFRPTRPAPAHEELVRRHAAGDRSLDLLQRLNETAWEEFHDPWETHYEPSMPAEEEMSALPDPEDSYDMERVRPLSMEMLERFARWKNWTCWRKSSHLLLVTFRYDPACDRETQICLSIQGKNDDILLMEWSGDQRVRPEQFDLAFRLCNDWNDECRWPRAYLEIPRCGLEDGEGEKMPDRPRSGSLTLDAQFMLGKGIHQALLDDMLREIVASGWTFWTWALERGL